MGYPAELETINLTFTNSPGPGAAALIREALEGTDDFTPLGICLGRIMAAANQACEFVETEDLAGNGIRVGEWVSLPDGRDALQIEVNQAKIRRGGREQPRDVGGD